MNSQPKLKAINLRSVPDWINLAFGLIMVILALAVKDIPTIIGALFGLALLGAVLWDLVKPSIFSAASQAIVGVLIFLLPWFGSFAGSGASWMAWTAGILTIMVAVWSWASYPNE